MIKRKKKSNIITYVDEHGQKRWKFKDAKNAIYGIESTKKQYPLHTTFWELKKVNPKAKDEYTHCAVCGRKFKSDEIVHFAYLAGNEYVCDTCHKAERERKKLEGIL